MDDVLKPLRTLTLLVGGMVAATLGAADAAIAELPPMPEAPLSVPLDMPYDGTVAVSISDADGKSMLRRVVSEQRVKAGANAIGWDLLDGDGRMVAPGTYRWTALAVPNLKLTYEGTVNNGGNPPWPAPAPAKGGGQWLADHAPPISACAVGDLMFLGAGTAESGHAVAVVDLDGQKVWGMGAVGGPWLGCDRIATDGRYAYIANPHCVLRVDPAAGFAVQDVVRFAYTADLPAPGGFGIAVRGDRLLVAVDAASTVLRGSAETAKMDLAACQPVASTRDGEERHYTTLQRWQAALGLVNGPASSTQAEIGPLLTDGAFAGTCTVAFNAPVPVASLLLSDETAGVWVLRPDVDPAAAGLGATAAPESASEESVEEIEPFAEELWQPLHAAAHGKDAGGAALSALDEPVMTRAIRFKSSRPLKFALPLDRRYVDVGAAATCVSPDGETGPRGRWAVQRDPAVLPISPGNQPAMVMVWPTEQSVRGVALVEPNEAYFAVDVWTGAAAPDAATCAGETSWREVGGFGAQMFGPSPQTPTFRLVDFGASLSIRAVRVRAFQPAGHRGYMGYEGLPVTGPHHASCSRVIAFSPLGGDLADLPPDLSQRLSEYRLNPAGTAEFVRHVPMPHPSSLAFAPDGTLHAISAGGIVSVDPATGATTTVIPASELKSPQSFAFGRDGELLITQWGDHSVVVRAGATKRVIGKAGGRGVGAFDPQTFIGPTGVSVASDGTIWIAEHHITPKRVTRWSADGKTLLREYFGPAQYGAGGWLDPRDPSLLYYRGMKFRFDWKTRASKLESIVFAPGVGPCLRTAEPDRPCYVGDRRYLVGDGIPIATICIERDGIAEPIVAAGNLNAWGDVDADPELRKRFGRMNRGSLGFVWSDQNGDRKPQPDEVQLVRENVLNLRGMPNIERVGEDLSLRFVDCRLRPTGFTDDGVPLYDPAKLESGLPPGMSWGNAAGETILVTEKGVRFTESDGKSTRWFYRDDYSGVHGSHRIGYDRPLGLLVGTNSIYGHFQAGPAGKQEDLYVVAGNHGDWFVFTHDGILAACLSGGPLHYGKKFWTFPECEPGKTDISDLCVGEEHFGGSVIRTDDGRVLMVAGHNHNSIVRVDGLDQITRLTGAVTVTKEDIERTAAFIVKRQIAERARMGERAMVMPYTEPTGINVDGQILDWDLGRFAVIEDFLDESTKKVVVLSSGGLASDSENLYIAGMVTDESPLQNAASDPGLSFKHGDAFDVTIGLDPEAARGRSDPVAGDARILLVPSKDGPQAVVYLPVVPGTPPDARRVFAFTGRTEIDRVGVVADAKVVFTRVPTGWIVEASIPWSELGAAAPEPGQKLLADIGLLKSDQNGVATVMRTYWTAKTQTVVSDVGFEARLVPALWGDLNVVEEEAPDLGVDGLRTR